MWNVWAMICSWTNQEGIDCSWGVVKMTQKGFFKKKIERRKYRQERRKGILTRVVMRERKREDEKQARRKVLF